MQTRPHPAAGKVVCRPHDIEAGLRGPVQRPGRRTVMARGDRHHRRTEAPLPRDRATQTLVQRGAEPQDQLGIDRVALAAEPIRGLQQDGITDVVEEAREEDLLGVQPLVAVDRQQPRGMGGGQRIPPRRTAQVRERASLERQLEGKRLVRDAERRPIAQHHACLADGLGGMPALYP